MDRTVLWRFRAQKSLSRLPNWFEMRAALNLSYIIPDKKISHPEQQYRLQTPSSIRESFSRENHPTFGGFPALNSSLECDCPGERSSSKLTRF